MAKFVGCVKGMCVWGREGEGGGGGRGEGGRSGGGHSTTYVINSILITPV